MLGHLLRTARSLPPREAARRAARFAARLAKGKLAGRLARRRCSYEPLGPRLGRRLGAIDRAALEPLRPLLAGLVPHYLDHRFDLLGSGWVRVAPGGRYAGFGPWRYEPAPPQDPWPANAQRVGAIRALLPEGYRPIDWQVDFKSGFRWSERTWGPGVAYGHQPGVDIKVPWELARLQHLPQLALAYLLDGDARLPAEFRAQTLDFLAANPPGWGVNWSCAMDVGIRAANLLLARDLFLAAGAAFDEPFEAELAAGMVAHGRFILGHLEHGGNHLLADLAGLLFVATWLGREDWRDFAARRLGEEIRTQFLPDGGNYEASTCYHRLSAEMALWAVALTPFPPEITARLRTAVAFTDAVTMPSGRVVQLGDNDSGRFLKLAPLGDLDHSGLLALGNVLLGTGFPVSPEAAVEGAVASALALSPGAAGGGSGWGPNERSEAGAVPHGNTPALRSGPHPNPPPPPAGEGTRLTIIPPDPAALDGLVPLAFPDFGLFLWKGPRAFIAVRCGAIGQGGRGGHAHNDQLAVEIEIDGIPWARDPGSFVYTADLAARDRYRSALAHFVPRHGTAEPARFLAPFQLEDRARAELLGFDGGEFLGRHHGFGEPVTRRVRIEPGRIVVEDRPGPGAEHVVRSPAELARLWGLTLTFSPGYGSCDKQAGP